MTKEKSKNRIVAEFLGFIYYHPNVDIDTSDCGGIYERFEIFSKVPIETNEYPDDNQYYFSDIPNPDYKNEDNPRWRSDLEKISWSSINYHEYIIEPEYDSSWDSLMPVIKKICIETKCPEYVSAQGFEAFLAETYKVRNSLLGFDLERTYECALCFIDWYNKKGYGND